MASRGPRDASKTNCPEFGDQLNGRTSHVPCATRMSYFIYLDLKHILFNNIAYVRSFKPFTEYLAQCSKSEKVGAAAGII